MVVTVVVDTVFNGHRVNVVIENECDEVVTPDIQDCKSSFLGRL